MHVIDAQRFDPPLETGWLPRPHREIVVLRRGVSEDLNAVEKGNGTRTGTHESEVEQWRRTARAEPPIR